MALSENVWCDYFEQQGHHRISIVDRFSAWLNIHHFPPTKVTSQTITTLRVLFIAYGIPEEISTNGGPNLHLKYLKTSFPSREYIIESLQLNTLSQMEGQNLALKLQNRSL